MGKRKICIICDTEYQLLNALGLINNGFVKNSYIDFYIDEKIIDRYEKLVNELEMFWKVNQVIAFDARSADSMLQKITKFFSPTLYIKSRMKSSNIFCEYEEIYIAVPTHFSVSLIFMNKNAAIYYYEDGTASYTENLVNLIYSMLSKVIYRFFGNDLSRVYPQLMYVNNLDFCTNCMCKEVRQSRMIKSGDNEYVNRLNVIFKTNTELYMNKRIMYLTQPLWQYNTYSSSIKRIDEQIKQSILNLENLVIRKHPADKCIYDDVKYVVDTDSGLWELICEDAITNDSILIALYSTAQLVPYILYSKMPYIVFLYYLYSDLLSKNDIDNYDETVKVLKQKYTDVSKIVVVKTITELEDFLSKIV
ncbi:MAG: hypothetical protein IJD40_01330 [Lachnospiraceae bacterium]|nr:hypothetical protein [Lachnospiraceae bacterium]